MENAQLDNNFVHPEEFHRMWRYWNLDENDYQDRQAGAAMRERIANSPRWNAETGGPDQCDCLPDRNGKGKCRLGRCINKNAGFECLLACNNQGDDAKCQNRPISNEDFVEEIEVRACPEPERQIGIFAKKEIPTGTYLGELRGVLGIGLQLPGKWAFPIGEVFRAPGQPMLFLDTRVSGNEFRFLNTSCVTNARLVSVAIKNELHLGIESTKTIKASDEVLLEYTQDMMDFIQVHPCNKRKCPIRRNMRDRPRRAPTPEPGNAAAAQAQEAAPRPRRRRGGRLADPLDDLDARLGFEFPGLGPIRGLRGARARARQAVPPHIQRQRIRIENELQRARVLAEIGPEDPEQNNEGEPVIQNNQQ